MAIKKQYTAALPVQLTPEWRERVKAVADHELVNISVAQVIRDCIEAALPSIEIQLGLLSLEELTDGELAARGLERPTAPVREDRAAGCFGAAAGAR